MSGIVRGLHLRAKKKRKGNKGMSGGWNKTHGMSRTRTYNSWHQMKQRSYTGTASCAKYYLDRGITMSERWVKFENFLEDMGQRPENTSLDRIDGSKGYYKENCRWATIKQQQRNRKCCVQVAIDGVTKPRSEWAEIYGIDNRLVKLRMKMGWDAAKAITLPKKVEPVFIEADGNVMQLSQACRLYGAKQSLVMAVMYKPNRRPYTYQEAFNSYVLRKGLRPEYKKGEDY